MAIVQTKRPRGRPLAFDRTEVLARAMGRFWMLGFEGASVPVLAEAMGISAQSLYAAFGSKEALYREAIDLYLGTAGSFMARALTQERDVIAALIQILREAASVYTQQSLSGCMITTAPGGTGDDALSAFGRQLRADGLGAMEISLKRGIDDRQIKAGTDCHGWARYVASVLYGMSVQARDGASRETLSIVADIAAQNLESLRL
jgi:AcrR family transcriptional regulator